MLPTAAPPPSEKGAAASAANAEPLLVGAVVEGAREPGLPPWACVAPCGSATTSWSGLAGLLSPAPAGCRAWRPLPPLPGLAAPYPPLYSADGTGDESCQGTVQPAAEEPRAEPPELSVRSPACWAATHAAVGSAGVPPDSLATSSCAESPNALMGVFKLPSLVMEMVACGTGLAEGVSFPA